MFNKYNNKNKNTNRHNKNSNQKLNRSYDGGENENQTIGSVKSNKPQNNKINNIKKLK